MPAERQRGDRVTFERGIPDVPALLSSARQRLDDRAERALLALPSLLARPIVPAFQSPQ